jgi:hypothetical protein
MRKSNKCEYTIGVNTRKKRKFLRPEEAVSEAERLNGLPNIIKKFIAYKCTTCNFFHVGRTAEDINKPNTLIFEEKIIEEVKEKEIITPKHDDFDWNNKNRYV